MSNVTCAECEVKTVEAINELPSIPGDEEHILFSTGCPKCNVLAGVLRRARIRFVVNNDPELMRRLGFKSVPVLYKRSINQFMNFSEAVEWSKRLR